MTLLQATNIFYLDDLIVFLLILVPLHLSPRSIQIPSVEKLTPNSVLNE